MTSKLRGWRVSAGLTQQEVADLTGLTQGSISRLELGEQHLSPRDRVLFARCVGARVADLFDPMPAPAPPAGELDEVAS